MLDRQTDTNILFALLLLFFKAILRLPHSTHETTSKVDNITIFMKKLEEHIGQETLAWSYKGGANPDAPGLSPGSVASSSLIDEDELPRRYQLLHY